MKHFNHNIKFLREREGLTQIEISKNLSISRTAWNNYETGVSRPNLDGLISIARYFDINEGDLLHTGIHSSSKWKKHSSLKGTDDITMTSIDDLRKTISAMEKVIEFSDKIKSELTQQLEDAEKIIVDYQQRLKLAKKKLK
jgi:transcriptional regulator with XRE-family HTH domain